MKKCRACGETKPLDEFHKSSSAPDGRQYRCKPCSISAARQRALDNPDAKREADRRYRRTDGYKARRRQRREGPQRERILQQKRDSWYRNHDANLTRQREREADPEFRRKARERYARWKQRHPRATFERWLKTNYGMRLDEYDVMLVRQQGRCAICQKATPDLCVDHCHKQGHIRALLCPTCNSGIGLFYDDPALMRAAVRYLMKHRRSE